MRGLLITDANHPGVFVHAPGLMPGVLTIFLEQVVTIPRVNSGAFDHAVGFMPRVLTIFLEAR